MKYSSILSFTIFLISISSVVQWCTLPIGNTFLWWFLQAIILLVFIKIKPIGYKLLPIRCFLILLFINALYGAIMMAENYWDWKMLVSNLMTFSLPLACFAFAKPRELQRIMTFWLKFAWILLLFLAPFLESDAYGRYLVPFSFLSLFLALLNRKFIVYITIAYLITIILGRESRSDMLKFSVTVVLGVFCSFIGYKRHYLKLLKIGTSVMFVLPIIFFILGATSVFNVFNIKEELKIDKEYTIRNDKGEDTNALADTRTFLYVEEISSAIDNNYILYGRSIARGYNSFYFGEESDRIFGVKRGERQSCETSILNIFNYFGLIGVLVYLWIFIQASYLALYRSNNIFIPLIGTYVAFRYVFAWIEDFSKFDLNYMFLWIMIGMCYSPWFRNMSNESVKKWIKAIIR